jgi:two-component system sensor histidine kinase KdpD
MCPGAGKTYAMLLAAQQRQEDGGKVAVGWVETHGRVETTVMASGLRRIPPRAVTHRGITLEEMDLDALLRDRPDVAVVDELAHTNAPGSRHPKRYQDVLELLAAGIDVFTTVNVQHIESRRDAVAKVTGIVVRETVPDSVIDRADEIELVDVTPEQLRQRLAEGKVYLGERAARAGESFFREGNLKALREMALRIVADHADREVRRHMKQNAIRGPWRSRERLMVAVAPSPHAERLVRLTRRLADGLDATWIAAHADTGAVVDEASRDRLSANLALARSLGAEVVSVSGSDAAEALVELARRENVTQIIAGKALHPRVWRPGLSERLVRLSGEIDVLLVHPGAATGACPPVARGQSAGGWWRDAVLAFGLLAAGSTLGLLVEPLLGYRSVTLLFLLVVAASGLFLRPGAVLGLAVASAAAWNLLFTEPRMTLVMWKSEDFVLLAKIQDKEGIPPNQHV